MLEENSGSASQVNVEQDVQTDTQESGQQSNDVLNQEKAYSQKQRQRAQKAESELEKMTAPAFTPSEFAPTMDDMKKLEVDIGQLYED